MCKDVVDGRWRGLHQIDIERDHAAGTTAAPAPRHLPNSNRLRLCIMEPLRTLHHHSQTSLKHHFGSPFVPLRNQSLCTVPATEGDQKEAAGLLDLLRAAPYPQPILSAKVMVGPPTHVTTCHWERMVTLEFQNLSLNPGNSPPH